MLPWPRVDVIITGAGCWVDGLIKSSFWEGTLLEASILFGTSSDVALQGEEFTEMKRERILCVARWMKRVQPVRVAGCTAGTAAFPGSGCCHVVLGRVGPALPALTTPNKGPC